MIITRKSEITGVVRSRKINVTKKQLEDWKSGTVIQKAMPELSDDEREFIMTGITSEEWDKVMKESGQFYSALDNYDDDQAF